MDRVMKWISINSNLSNVPLDMFKCLELGRYNSIQKQNKEFDHKIEEFYYKMPENT